MKKFIASLLMGTLTFSLVACGSAASEEAVVEQAETAEEAEAVVEAEAEVEAPTTVTITSYNGSKEAIELEVPYNPERIAILDLAALDIIDNLGVGDRVVGTADTSIDYLASYAENSDIANLGNIKEADLEAVMQCEPDVIFIGGRLATSYDALSEIAPVVFLATDTEIGLVESVKNNALTIASMFGLEDQVAAQVADFDARIAALAEVADGQTALVGMVTSGSFNLLGNNGRCSLIGVEVGFENLTGDTEESENRGGDQGGQGGEGRGEGNGQGGEGRGEGSSEGRGESGSSESGSPHGNESSFETVVAENPDYIFVLDRDSAIGTEGATLAEDVMNNELVNGTDAYANGHIVYLANPAVWYTAEGGITALDIMIQDLESELLN